jgi:thioredoxin reductase
MYDAVVVGGGPAGLSAAQQLARACASTLVLDAGVPRNARAEHVNGYAGLDGVSPAEFRRRVRDDLARYPEVELLEAWVDRIEPQPGGGFEVGAGDRSWRAGRVLLATGVVDVLPDLPDVDAFWGTSVVQCPFCHGWEARSRPAALVVGDEAMLSEMLRFHRRWATALVALADPGWDPTPVARQVLADAGVALHEAPVVALHGHDGVLQELEFADGSTADVGTVYVHNEQRPTDLVRGLRLDLALGAYVAVRKDYAVPDPTLPLFATSAPGIYAAGDATSMAQAAQLAAFEGALAARRMVLDQAFAGPGR